MVSATTETNGIRQLPLWQITVKLKELTEANRNVIENIVKSLGKSTAVTEASKRLVGDYDLKTHLFYQSACNDCAEIFGLEARESPLAEAVYIDRVR